MPAPRISVLLPYRDAESTLMEALESVCAQQGPSFEVLCVNDHSSDGGLELVEALAGRDGRVRVLSLQGERGIVAALNLGIRASQAPLLARMDGDDRCLPGRFEAQYQALQARQELAALATRVELFPERTPGFGAYVDWQNQLLEPQDHAQKRFIASPICHPSVMLRKSALLAVGGYENPPWAEDYDLWLRLTQAGYSLAKLPQVYLQWRHHPKQASLTDERCSKAAFIAARAHYLAPLLKKQKRPWVIWGAGPRGKSLARELEKYELYPACFLDVAKKKIGSVARGAPIRSALDYAFGDTFVVAAVGNVQSDKPSPQDAIAAHLKQAGLVEVEDFILAA